MNEFVKELPKIPLIKENIYGAPPEPGIYIFMNGQGDPHYVGKSVSLRDRLKSYISPAVIGKTKEMVKESSFFTIIRVNSELESLLLEAKLIKMLIPKYNIELKDDKHPLYIKITRDAYPRVITARKSDLESDLASYGPFPSSFIVKNFLKKIRRIIPYSDHQLGKKACLYNQIGLCSPCPNVIEALTDPHEKKKFHKIYKKNIRLIKDILDGKIDKVYEHFRRKMTQFSLKSDFENAIKMRDQLRNLEYITQSITAPREFLKNPNLLNNIRAEESEDISMMLAPYFGKRKYKRVECYDIAHLGGSKPTASMVTFVDGEADKGLYRRFKIDKSSGGDDYKSLKEVAVRRSKHLQDWGEPDLMIIDGGKGQVTEFTKVFQKYDIPIVGLAKRFETVIIPIDTAKKLFHEVRLRQGKLRNYFQRIRNEAHRFARRYHHHLVEKEYKIV
jgi:excinuclease ABC subunit C